VVAKNDIQSIKDLKGKTVAFPEGQPSHCLSGIK
jgi:ABC-type nitrate/sulfonate/bicarbonate transport system substrate-binding protein